MAANIRFGVMARGQYPAGDDMSVRFGELVEQAKLAERLGYDCIAKSSHYSAHPMQEIQQIPLLARLSAETPNLRLSAGSVLPTSYSVFSGLACHTASSWNRPR